VATDVIKLASCISEQTYADTLGKISTTSEWHLNIPFEISKEAYLDLQCSKKDAGLKKILPSISGVNDVLIYHSCPANVYTASKRDCLEVTEPCNEMVDKFLEYYDRIFTEEIEPLLQNFDYDYNAWYNTLNRKQQKRVDTADLNNLHRRKYQNFCKKEKQEITDPNKYPKNRCITGPNEEYKYVMGPVVKRLELIFKKNFKGYTSGKNWDTKEKLMNQRRLKQLLMTIEGDGSGFDRSQYLRLKEVEFRIYRYLAEKGYITHVDAETFLQQATKAKVVIEAMTHGKVGKYNQQDYLGYYIKEGCTQSGNMDTSFANTLRMCMYNRFIVEELYGLTPEQYDLDTAGDDFTTYLPLYTDLERMKECYYKVFSVAKTGVHGLGQILKFMKVGSIEDVDFCSTQTFWSEKMQSYKIIRKLDRMLPLNTWSQKALSMSEGEQRQYMLDLYEANKLWIGRLPIYFELNELLYAHAMKLRPHIGKPKKTPSKQILRTNKQHLYENHEEFERLEAKIGTDDAYAYVNRISDKNMCEDDFINYLTRKYGVTTSEINETRRLITNMQHIDVSQEVHIPQLLMMLDNKKENYDMLCTEHDWLTLL